MPLPRPKEYEFDLAILPVPGEKRANMFDSGTREIKPAPNIGIKNGMITAIGDNVQFHRACFKRIVRPDQLIVPEMTDIHVHTAPSCVWSRKTDMRHCQNWNVGSFADAGSMGCVNGPEYFRSLRDNKDVHGHAFINIASQGLVLPFGETKDGNFDFIDIDETVRVAMEFPDIVAGVKVRIGKNECGKNWKEVLKAAITAAARLKKPIMVHVSDGPPKLDEILAMLRPGDIVTHCFHGKHPNDKYSIVRGEQKKVIKAVVEAQNRGVIFDVGHGGGSYDSTIAMAALAGDFLPDTISSDLHDFSQDKAQLLDVISKIVALGVDIRDALTMVTTNAARAIGKPGPRIAVGNPANLAVLEDMKAGEGAFFEFTDAPMPPRKPTTVKAEKSLQKAWLVTNGVAM